MSIWSMTLAALTGLGKPLAQNTWRKSSASPQPTEYITYFLVDSVSEEAADDVETLRTHRVQVTYYSTTGFAGMPDIVGAMVTAGYAHDTDTEIPLNPETGHYGLALDFILLDEE